jgi:hypothetical protein
MDGKAMFGGEYFDGRRRDDLFATHGTVGLREYGDYIVSRLGDFS